MRASSLDQLIQITNEILEDVMSEEKHLTPTLNDIYDTFNKLGLRIERTQYNSEEIIKILKQNNKITRNQMLELCFSLYLSNKPTA